MKCPFCRSDIADEAVVCAYCSRDVAFLRPFMDEIVALRRDVTAHSAAIQNLSSSMPVTEREIPARGHTTDRWRLRAVAVIMIGVMLETMSYAIVRQMGTLSRLLFVMMTALPFPLGLWFGRYTVGRRWGLYLPVGAATSVLGFLGTLVYWWVESGSVANPFSDTDASIDIAILLLGPIVIFAGGCLFGDWFEARSKGLPRHALATRLAEGLVPKGSDSSASPRGSRVARLAEFVAALGPILTLVGTLATGWLTYLAATQANQTERPNSFLGPKSALEEIHTSPSVSSVPLEKSAVEAGQ